MERLTKRDKGGNAVMDCDNCDIKFRESCCSKKLCYDQLVNRLADYEDAEEQGLLIRFPCMIRDTVFAECNTHPIEGTVESVVITDRSCEKIILSNQAAILLGISKLLTPHCRGGMDKNGETHTNVELMERYRETMEFIERNQHD